MEVTRKNQAEALFRATMLHETPIRVSSHKTLNFKKRVICCPELKDCEDDHVLAGLEDQGASEIRRTRVLRQGT